MAMRVQKSIVHCGECDYSQYSHLDSYYECKNKESYRYGQEMESHSNCRFGKRREIKNITI